ncbi:MAG: transketolase, partial [Clostridia bacterium]|nr:transketolase [Clostridia bacterium]
MNYTELARMGNVLRRDIIEMIYRSGDGHPAPSLSCADIIACLYFGVMNVRPDDPHWEDRDRFVLSKGHACPALYAALARKGYFSPELYPTLRRLDSALQGHPDMKKTPGVDMT